MALVRSCPPTLSPTLHSHKSSVIVPKFSISIAETAIIPKISSVPISPLPNRRDPVLAHRTICGANPSSSVEPHNSPSTGVFIKGLPLSTAEGRLKNVFSQFGDIKQVHVVREKTSKESLGSAFVWFESDESAQLAVEQMNGKFFDGRFISVKIAVPGQSRNRKSTTPYRF